MGFEPVTFRLRVGRGNHCVTRPLLKCASINMFYNFNMTGRGKGGKEEGKAKQVRRGFWPQMTEKCRKCYINLNHWENRGSNEIIVISISRNRLLKSCARFVIERSEIRKKQHDFKSAHFECRMVLFYMIWEKSRL